MWSSRSRTIAALAALAACVPGWATGDDKQTFCDSDAVEIGGSLVGAGSMAWLAMRGRIGPVAGTVSGVASEKFGAMLGPSFCNFIRRQLFDDAGGSGSVLQAPFPRNDYRAPGLSVDAPLKLPAPNAGSLSTAHWMAVEAAIKAQTPAVNQPPNPFVTKTLRGLGTLGDPALGRRFPMPPQRVPLSSLRSVLDGITIEPGALAKPK